MCVFTDKLLHETAPCVISTPRAHWVPAELCGPWDDLHVASLSFAQGYLMSTTLMSNTLMSNILESNVSMSNIFMSKIPIWVKNNRQEEPETEKD